MAKYISPEEFIKYTKGNAYDVDHYAGSQCVDGIAKFVLDIYGEHNFNCGSCGYAYGLWTNYGTNGVEKYFIQLPLKEAKEGDWIIWNKGSKPAPKSHVAMFYKWVNNNTISAYGQNQNGKAYFNFANTSISGVLGVLRPRIYLSTLKYRAYIEDIGWQEWKYSGEIAGTMHQSKRLEAIQIDYDKEVEAKAHIQEDGWVDYGTINKDTVIGTQHQSKRLECLCLKGNFNFRVYMQDYGWTTYTRADGICTLGSVGQLLRIEAIELIERQ